jgi:hypothetical protein
MRDEATRSPFQWGKAGGLRSIAESDSMNATALQATLGVVRQPPGVKMLKMVRGHRFGVAAYHLDMSISGYAQVRVACRNIALKRGRSNPILACSGLCPAEMKYGAFITHIQSEMSVL